MFVLLKNLRGIKRNQFIINSNKWVALHRHCGCRKLKLICGKKTGKENPVRTIK